MRVGWLIVALVAIAIVAAGVFVVPVLLPDKATAYRPAPSGTPTRQPGAGTSKTQLPAPSTPPTATVTPSPPRAETAAVPLLQVPSQAAPTPLSVPTTANVTAAPPVYQASSPTPTFETCPPDGVVTMRLTAAAREPRHFNSIMDGIGVTFSGVFENRGDVSVTLSRGLMHAYGGDVPQPGSESPLTEIPYGEVPAHGTLPFTLEEMAMYNNMNGTTMWRVAGDIDIYYYVRGEFGAHECSRVPPGGPPLAFTR